MKSHFFEANIALNLFIDAQAKSFPKMDQEMSRTNWEHDMHRRSEIESAIVQKHGGLLAYSDRKLWDEIHFETEVIFKRERWESGILPREFSHNLPFIYARAFLYALDTFDKVLGVLAKEDRVPTAISGLHSKFVENFPHLRGVRNTVQHIEDRGRGLGSGKVPQKLDLKPIENNFIQAPGGGVLVLNNLNGSKYGSTMADGHFGEIDVSVESMKHLKIILEEVLNSFKWHGPRHHEPSA